MVLLTFELIKYTIIDNYSQDTFDNVADSCHPWQVCPSLAVKPKTSYFNACLTSMLTRRPAPPRVCSSQKLLPAPMRYCRLEDKAAAWVSRRKEQSLRTRGPAHFSCHEDTSHWGTSPLLLYLHKEDTVEARVDEARPLQSRKKRFRTGCLKTKESFLGRSVAKKAHHCFNSSFDKGRRGTQAFWSWCSNKRGDPRRQV